MVLFKQFHPDVIRDITFVHESWPFHKSSQSTLLTLSCQGTLKINAFSGSDLHSFDFNHVTNSIVSTPERYGSAQKDGFTSALVTGGTVISSYTPPEDCLYNNGVNGDESRGNNNTNHSFGNSNVTENAHNNNHSSSGNSHNSITSSVLNAYAPLRRHDILLNNVETIRITRNIRHIVASTQHHYYQTSSSSLNSTPTFVSTLTSDLSNIFANNDNGVERNQSFDLTQSASNNYSLNQVYFHDRWDNSATDQPQQIWRLKYSNNGAFLYAAGEGGAVRYYRRYPNSALKRLGEIFSHRSDVLDMDISPYDECNHFFKIFPNLTINSICRYCHCIKG